jgi:hypothetical protein
MAGGLDFAGMVPGFDFLQGLMKGAGAAMPAMGQWVAPTLDPAELDKRIGELRTVQFWLEQNAKLLGTTIQAMEVQRMTLATLQTMNLPMADLRDALSIKPAEAAAPAFAPRPPAPPVAPPAPVEPPPRVEAAPAAEAAEESEPATAPAAAAVDPMKWWGALTQQFTEIASKAMQASAVPPGAPATEAAAAAPAPAATTRRRGAPSPAPARKKAAAKKAATGTARARRA